MEQTPVSVSIATPTASPSNSEVSLAAIPDTPLKDSLNVQSGSATAAPSGTTMTSPPISPIPYATNDSHLASPQPALALPKTHVDTIPEVSSDYYSGSGGDNSQDDSDTVAHHQQISALSSPSMGAQALDDNDPHAGYAPESDANAAVPTLEQLGLHNLSGADLAMMLQQAYEMIQEKERGKSRNGPRGWTISPLIPHPHPPPPKLVTILLPPLFPSPFFSLSHLIDPCFHLSSPSQQTLSLLLNADSCVSHLLFVLVYNIKSRHRHGSNDGTKPYRIEQCSSSQVPTSLDSATTPENASPSTSHTSPKDRP